MNTTVCIPVAPYHKDIVQRAIDSAEKQTRSCQVLYSIDEEGKGPGYVRNYLLRHVETPYVVFLDADDWLEPTFVEECERVIKPGRYVYTDWWQDDKYVNAPSKPWCNGTWHVITTMVHTEDARKVGVFDETLPALEDTDFWLKMTTNRICGQHIPKALSHYGKGGLRAKAVFDNGTVEQLRQEINRRYGGDMGCCGNQVELDMSIPVGERQSNDVLAQALWGGNRPEYGRYTRRWYPRMSYPQTTWVDKRDVEMSPNLWKEVVEPSVTDAQRGNGNDVFRQIFHKPRPEQIAALESANIPSEPPVFTPDVGRVVDIAQERL